jgi:pilus assembly protein CpaE
MIKSAPSLNLYTPTYILELGDKMTNTIAFVSIKGGVGKTTLALETASSLANHYNKKVLLIDANFSAPNIGLHFNLTNEVTLHDALNGLPLHNTIYEAHGIDIIPADLHYDGDVDPFKLKKLIAKFKPRYDYIIIDSSPNYEELKPVMEAADKIFLVSSPDHITLETTMKAAKLAKEQKTPIHGIIVNKIRSPRHEMNLAQIEEMSDIPVVAKIKSHNNMAKSTYYQKPLTILEPHNPVSKEIRRFSSAICGEPEFQNKLLEKLLTKISKEKINRDMLRQNFYEKQIK